MGISHRTSPQTIQRDGDLSMKSFYWKIKGSFIWWREVVQEEGFIHAMRILKAIWRYNPEEDREDTY